MPSGSVAGFVPSLHGFHFANTWPSVPAWSIGFGLLRLGIGDASRGLCGGMSHAVRDRFERSERPPSDPVAPPAGTALYAEIARRQLDSFDRLVVVPWRFWWASVQREADRAGATASEAWPAIRAEIDAGRLAMVGIVRTTGANPFRSELGHQVVAYRYAETAEAVTIGIYDPNHPDDDAVELAMGRDSAGRLQLSQSTGEPIVALLHLPYAAPG